MSKKKINLAEITKYVPKFDIANKYYAFLKKIFPRGWITDVKAIFIPEVNITRLYICIKLEAYEKIYNVKIHGFRVSYVFKKLFGITLKDYEEREKHSLEDMIFGGKLKYWFDEFDEYDEISLFYLIDTKNGYPYADGSNTYYSAKEQKIFHTKVPPTRTKDEDGEYKINPCSIFNTKEILNSNNYNITLSLPNYKYGKLVVTHCFDSIRRLGIKYSSEHDEDLTESQKSIAESIKSCGGLLFPSIAISDIPATQFGFNVMVLNTDLIKGWFDKKPRVVKTLPYYIYNTDGYTGTSAAYFGEFSRHLYNECYDGMDIMYKNLSLYASQNFDIEENKFQSYRREEIKVVTTKVQLARALNHKKEIMDKVIKESKKMTEEEFNSYFSRLGHDQYWLSEVKFSRVLDINCFMMCICPDYMYKNTKMFLENIGFTGKIIPISLTDELRKKMMESNYLHKVENEYALLVRKKILELDEMKDQLNIVSNGTIRTNEPMWQKIVQEVKADNKGGKPGQWSARKAQLAVKLYKDSGGGYIGKKEKDNSLVKWTEQKWRTKSGEKSSITGERYLPEKAIQALTDEEYNLTSRIKRKGMKVGIQFVKQPDFISKKVAKYRK